METEITDWQLIKRYASQNSQAAFAELLRRYTDMVYCTCLRELGEPTLAEDAAQAVFLVLARKAHSLHPRTRGVTLSGWLFQTAILTSRNLRRKERRRQEREQEAAQMQHSQSSEVSGWLEMEPILNDALQALSSSQRALILERFFQERPLAEIGAGRGISEDAARMRINRAMERLRRFFAARSVVLPATALAALLPQAVRPARAHSAEAILRQDLLHTGSSKATTSAHIIAQGAINNMTMKRLRLQLAAVALVAALSFGTARAVRVVRQAAAHAAIVESKQDQAPALAVLNRMYATYAAMHSFRCNVTSREYPLDTAQNGAYEIDYPNKIRFHRATLIGDPNMSGEALVVSDGHDLYVTCTEDKGLADRYAKIPLIHPDSRYWFADFGGIPAWGTEPDAGMPDAALGIRLHETPHPQMSAPEYSLGQPTVIDFPGIAYPVPLDVVVAHMHWIAPGGAMKDDPEVVTYYIGQRDHLLYKLTAAYMLSPTEWDTRTETYNSIQVNQKLDPKDFVFTPPTGSHEVDSTNDLFVGGRM